MKRSRGRNPKRNSHIKRQLDMVWYRLAAFGIECREIMCRRLFMCRMIGFILFWVAVGIAFSLCFRSPVFRTLLALVLLVCGFNLFCK